MLCNGCLRNFDDVIESSIVESKDLGTFYKYIK